MVHTTPPRTHSRMPLRARLYWNTIRHLSPDQCYHLFRHRVRSLLNRFFPTRTALVIRGEREKLESAGIRPRKRRGPAVREGPVSRSEQEAIRREFKRFREGRICILNRDYSFPEGDLWHPGFLAGLAPLVQETLHYHRFLNRFSRILRSDSDEEETREITAFLERHLADWWRRFPPGKGTPWHPYTVACRIREWVEIHDRLKHFAAEVSPRLQRSIPTFLLEHGVFLERNLELHLGGNHLLKDLCALALLAVFFEGEAADRWYRTSTSLLERELATQILEDGGHYERSPMYHSLVLADLMRTADSLRDRNPDWVEKHMSRRLKKMQDFLGGILHGDSELPFFNDTVLGQAPPPRSLIGKERDLPPREDPEGEEIHVFPDTGLTRIRRDGWTLIVDHGPLGPDELMGHVHSDTLSFELSFGSRRFVVNRGVYEYTEGERREEARSIRSHNTPCVDGLEQCETWKSFRVGRRWPIRSWSVEKRDNGVWKVGGGWKREGMPDIERNYYSLPGGTIVIADRFRGEGVHELQIPFHFGPEVGIREVRRPFSSGERVLSRWEAERGGTILYGWVLGECRFDVKIEKTVWWPRFYVEEGILRLIVEARVSHFPVRLVTVLAPSPDTVTCSHPHRVTLQCGKRSLALESLVSAPPDETVLRKWERNPA